MLFRSHKGLVGTVLCIETSTTNNGAVLLRFSQYPEEEETVWNACSFLQHLPGREEVVLPPGGGVVRIYHVLVSANSRAETVEELEGRRKRVVVQVLDTLHADVCRAVDAAAKTEEFEKRLAEDRNPGYKDEFIRSIKDESAAHVAVYKALPDGAFAEIETLGEAVSKGLALPLLSNAKLRLWLEDPCLHLIHMTSKSHPNYLGLNAAQGRRLAQRRLLLEDSSAAVQHVGVDCGVGARRNIRGRMGGKTTWVYALEDCLERRLVTGVHAAALERKDRLTGHTPLITQVQLGEYENALRLLQAGADANAATADGDFALLMAAKEGREDLVAILVSFRAKVDVCDAKGGTPLHWASDGCNNGGHLAVVQALLKLGADVDAKYDSGKTSLDYAKGEEVKAALREHGAKHSLFYAAEQGNLELVSHLIKGGAHVNETNRRGQTSLHYASWEGHLAVVQTLLEHGADVAARSNEGKTPYDCAKNEEVRIVFDSHSLPGLMPLPV